MLFNCINCCKAISSRAHICPYCLVSTDQAVRKMALYEEPIQIPTGLVAKRKIAFIKRLTERLNRTRQNFPGTITEVVTKSQLNDRIQRA